MSLLARRATHMALVPAGAALTITSAALFLGENASKASSRAATVSVRNASQILTRRFAAANEPTKTAELNVRQSSTAFPLPKKRSLMDWYEGHLQARPVQTKMVTGAILWGVGDTVAQVVPVMTAPRQPNKKLFEYDWARTGRAAFFGFAIHAPCSHIHFNFLEYLTVRAGVTGLKIPLFKAFMEQFVYWSWFSNSLYHGAMGAMQGQTPNQIYHRISDVLWETQKAQWVFWIPIQLLNFRFVPVRHQLNVVLLTSVAWTALLSAWYPPEDTEKDEPKEKK